MSETKILRTMKSPVFVFLLFICGTQGVEECPRRDPVFHKNYAQASRGVNKLFTGEPRFGINSEVYDSYRPGSTYEFELGRSDLERDEVSHFYIVSSSVEDSPGECSSLGSWKQLTFEGPKAKLGCEHVLEYRGTAQQLSFTWTAPECGCVTLSAVVVTEGEFFTDDADKLQGPLTMTLCPEEDDDVAVPSPYDEDFYGIEEEDKDPINEIMDEVTNIMTEAEEEDDDEEVLDEEEELEHDSRREYKRGNWRKKFGRGRGKGRRWMRKYKEEDDDEPEVMDVGTRRRKGFDRPKFWKKKMGLKARAGPNSAAMTSDRLEKVCTMIEEKADAPISVLSPKKSILTERALEERRERWTTFRRDMQTCCTEENERRNDSVLSCFKEAHGRRIEERMCGASDEHFKEGDVPEAIAAAQEKCCQTEGEEKNECLIDALKVIRKLKRQSKRTAQVDSKAKVAAICKRVDKRPVPEWQRSKLAKLPVVQKNRWTTLFTERRLQMIECCKLDEEEQESCMADLREQRLDRVCLGEDELTPPWHKTAGRSEEITNACCVLEGEERYECFAEKRTCKHGRGHRGRKMRRHHHKHTDRDDETEDVTVTDHTDEEDRKENAGPAMRKRRITAARWRARKNHRDCCQGGRTAAALLGKKTGENHWQTCHQEARGYTLAKEEENPEAKRSQPVCLKSFRKCCIRNVIRRRREEAVEEYEQKNENQEEP